ncbi:hypothetical protein Fleli_3576 [Bernardetia litoralis DSM 6794]|uniref:Uncharacterized protein n=1 Tax=Bernardetia litoralis (strain ATCC 23117 / DSM 6794 / NBRC 15988 / NCIMB 1366 / Fx l1 / Sio-4) TaxID=880071 RepID=I4APK9_BERLS|nr:hypothetical protein [Bernardetia litoralis]AFM05894.1 hypothetical protein Fleli_3576 [Bernardetia litoralis DSM 6794]
MKFLFVLLLPFLVSINSISNENNLDDRIKCCEFYPEKKKEYFEDNYQYIESMRIDMAHRNRNQVEYTLVADQGDELKYITEFEYKNIGNLEVSIKNSKRIPIKYDVENIDEKRIQLKTVIPIKGIYYLSFSKKDNSDDRLICAITLLFKK